MSGLPDPAELPPLKIFIDRSIQGRRMIAAVRNLVADVETINERYGLRAAEETADHQWIAEASADDRILLGADLRIRRNPIERQAVCLHRARYVVFGNNNMSPKTMIDLFARNLSRIQELTARPGPWVQRIAQAGNMDPVTLWCGDVEGNHE